MILKTRMLGQTYEFKDVKDVLAKASEKKSGDELAGVGAESALERIAAKEVLAQLTVADLTEHPVVPYEEDAVTRIIQDDIDETVYGTIKDRTIQEMREWILCDVTDSGALMRASRGMTSEVIAGISKIMSNMDLILAGSKIRVTATCNTTIGTENVLASRLQPNHPVDDVEGVAASTLEGLSYGIGDAVIRLNPAIDTVDSTLAIWKVLGDIRDKYEIPTQTCVLSHVTTQMEALRTGQGSADLCFQSIAGSEAALSAFGINTGMLSEAEMLFREEGPAKGPNVMYFETGRQRSADDGMQMLRSGTALSSVSGEHGGRFHGAGVYLRHQAAHKGGARGRLLRASARTADGLRRMLYESHADRSERLGDDPDTSGNGGRSLCDGTAAGG